ncbi:hypothetical protein BD560DRAFT_464511 [Blakeslea trispora]|nr:hypothetical protein BD560DRAFT_464511 [Blakeslea trispora]
MNEVHDFYMNKPSEYLKFLMADPVKGAQLTTLPDHTTCETKSFQQGEKWRTHESFQQPMTTLRNGDDIWVTDLVRVNYIGNWECILVSNFHTKKEDLNSEYITYLNGFPVKFIGDNAGLTCVAIDENEWAFPLSSVYQKVDKVCDARLGYRSDLLDTAYWPIPNDHKTLPFWNDQHSALNFKRQKADGSFMKVMVAPIVLFSDDTSGNQSKQYNVFDSYLMTPAALSFDARSSKNNTYFICTSNKKLSAVNMLPALVDDLVELENGIVMYSVSHNEDVLVVAPLLLISGDNFCQSELSMHIESFAGHFIRKCLMSHQAKPNRPLRKNASRQSRLAYEANRGNPKLLAPINHHECQNRTIEDLQSFLLSRNARYLKEMKKKGYGKNGQELLRLKAFNPILDTPVELLHTIPLGVGKGLLQLLWQEILTVTQKDLLQKAITDQRTSPAYTRNLRATLNHNGSFVGRDFKQLIQVLPAILRRSIPNIPKGHKLDLIAECFDTLGSLTSLLYMRSVEGELNGYTSLIMSLVKELSDRIFALDNHLIMNGVFADKILSLQPKLHHLKEDIICFGLPVHYETEHGEQFNKFIREEIMRPNRHNPSKDVATSFAKQFAVHHVVNGGSFIVTKTRRNGTTESKRIMGAGYQIKIMKEEEPQFFDLILNHRENADNNDYYEKTGEFLRAGTAGVSFIYFDRDSGSGSLFPGWLTTQDNNIVMRRTTTVIQGLANEIELFQRFDMHLSLRFNKPELLLCGDFKMLNIHKFGTLWTILQRYC